MASYLPTAPYLYKETFGGFRLFAWGSLAAIFTTATLGWLAWVLRRSVPAGVTWIALMWVLLSSPIWAWSMVKAVNIAFDSSKEQVHHVRYVEHVHHAKSSDVDVVTSWKTNSDTVDIDARFWPPPERDTPIRISTRKGFLGIEWLLDMAVEAPLVGRASGN